MPDTSGKGKIVGINKFSLEKCSFITSHVSYPKKSVNIAVTAFINTSILLLKSATLTSKSLLPSWNMYQRKIYIGWDAFSHHNELPITNWKSQFCLLQLLQTCTGSDTSERTVQRPNIFSVCLSGQHFVCLQFPLNSRSNWRKFREQGSRDRQETLGGR